MRKGERIEVNDRKTNNMALPWEEIIPSPEVRHLIENGTVPLSDTDLATLVCNMQASPKTIRRNLVRIYEMTGDRKLKEQLKTEWEKQDGKSEKLMENGNCANL